PRPPRLFRLERAVRDPAPLPRPLDRLAAGPPLLLVLRLADRAPVLAELEHDFRDVSEPPDFAEAQPQVQVLRRLEVRVVVADAAPPLPPDHCGGVADRGVAGEQQLLDPRVVARRPQARQQPTLLVDQ